MRPTDTFKDAVTDQRLQDRLEVPGRPDDGLPRPSPTPGVPAR